MACQCCALIDCAFGVQFDSHIRAAYKVKIDAAGGKATGGKIVIKIAAWHLPGADDDGVDFKQFGLVADSDMKPPVVD